MSKKSITDLIGRSEAFRLMEKAVVAAAKKNKEAGLTTASHINALTVFVIPKAPISVALKKPTHRKARSSKR